MLTVSTVSFAQLKDLAGGRKNVRYHVLDANGDVILAVAFDQSNATIFNFSFATPIAPASDTWFNHSAAVTSAG